MDGDSLWMATVGETINAALDDMCVSTECPGYRFAIILDEASSNAYFIHTSMAVVRMSIIIGMENPLQLLLCAIKQRPTRRGDTTHSPLVQRWWTVEGWPRAQFTYCVSGGSVRDAWWEGTCRWRRRNDIGKGSSWCGVQILKRCLITLLDCLCPRKDVSTLNY